MPYWGRLKQEKLYSVINWLYIANSYKQIILTKGKLWVVLIRGVDIL